MECFCMEEQQQLSIMQYKNRYDTNIISNIIPTGLHINKKPGINTVLSDFLNSWKTIISKAEKDLVQLLPIENKIKKKS